MNTTQVKQCGFVWNIRLENGFEDLKIITEIVSKDEYDINKLAEYIHPDVILDVGGHIGSFGVLAKSKWPDAQLIAIEPCRESVILYRRNLKDNGLDKNTVVIKAGVVYDKKKTCLIHSSGTSGGYLLGSKLDAELYILEGYRGYNGVLDDSVRTITIEEICKTYNIDKIGLAKWDCEGGEIDAFMKMDPETRKKFSFMVGEYHLWNDETRYLKCPKFYCYTFWDQVKRNFRHLKWNYKNNRLGLFQAWPKTYSTELRLAI